MRSLSAIGLPWPFPPRRSRRRTVRRGAKGRWQRIGRRTAICLALGLAGCASAPPPAALSSAQQAEIGRIETYLNGIGSLTARFAETWPNGTVTPGTVHVLRPGRLRLDYDPPATIGIVADGRSFIYHDARTGQLSYEPLSETPVGLLLARRIDLGGNATITGFAVADGVARLALVDKQHPGQGTLTLVLDEQPMALREWVLTDPHGTVTRMRLSDIVLNGPVDPAMFGVRDWLPPGAPPPPGE